MKSILDPTFVYTPSYATNIAARFSRINAELDTKRKAQLEQDNADSAVIHANFAARRNTQGDSNG